MCHCHGRSGTKLNREVAKRQAQQRNEINKLEDADTEAKHKRRETGRCMSPEAELNTIDASEKPMESSVPQAETRSYASVVSQGTQDMGLVRKHSDLAFKQKTTTALRSKEYASDDDNYEEFTTATNKDITQRKHIKAI